MSATCHYPNCDCEVTIHAVNSEPVCPKGLKGLIRINKIYASSEQMKAHNNQAKKARAALARARARGEAP